MHNNSLLKYAFEIASKDGFYGHIRLAMDDLFMIKYKEQGFSIKAELVNN